MTTKYDPITPGQYLEHEFLEPLGLTQAQLARDLDVPASRISEIIHGNRAITADTATRLGLYFKTSAQMWMNLQSYYDLQIIKQYKFAVIKTHVRPLKRAS